MSTQPTMFVVDDDAVSRESLRYLAESVRLRSVAFESAEEFLLAYRGERPACLVVDLFMPGMSGLELQAELKQRGIDLPVIVVTAHGDVPTAVRALRAGAVDFFEKPVSPQSLLDRVREEIRLDADRRERQMLQAELRQRFATLTAREREVFAIVAEGNSSKEVAVRLGASVNTVQNHRAKIMRKMGAASVGALVRMFAAVHSAA